MITRLQPGQTLRILKYLAYGWSSRRSIPALHDQVRAALAAARYTGWDGLLAEQRDYLDEFWATADVEIDGDAELQQAVRLAVFHVLQAGARAERRCIGAKGLTGEGYDGHTFWDTETFCLQVLSFVAPDAAADALRWRQSILPLAYERAEQLGLKGAAFPWRTIRGQECSGYWPAGTAAFHINADIADAVRRHVAATGDVEFEREVGLELLVATARLWRSLGHHDAKGEFRIDGVTGPDEYTAIVDNNVYTNLMAQLNLRVAADTAARHARAAARLGVNSEEMASWRDAATAIRIPYDEHLQVHPQAEGFTDHQVWDFEHTDDKMYPLLLHVPYFDLYRKQVCKQADLVLAMQLRPDAFTAEQMARNFAYYEGDHGSRLVAVGVHPGGDRGLDRAPGPGLRLPGRGRARRLERPGRELRPRRAHRVDGRHLDGGGGRVRRDALRRDGLAVRATAAACAVPAVLRAEVAGSADPGHDPPRGGGVPAGQRAADAAAAPRRAGRPGRGAGDPGDPGAGLRRAGGAALRSRPPRPPSRRLTPHPVGEVHEAERRGTSRP